MHRDRQLLQFTLHTAEVADSVLKLLLFDVGLPGELRLRREWRNWRKPLVRASFASLYTAYTLATALGQPVEFTAVGGGISLVAVLRTGD